MNHQIPDFIEYRICNHTLSKYVVSGSTPIPFFGNFFSSATYTIGINPSVKEFSLRKDKLLDKKQKRLEDFETLDIPKKEFPYPISSEHVPAIFNGCLDYFKRNPYHWFNHLESTVNTSLNSSYFNGTACHLDLVQWATNPIWGGILEKDPTDAGYLLDQDLPFLLQQISWLVENNQNLKYFVLSGRTVVESLKDIFRMQFIGKTDVPERNREYSLFMGSLGNIKVFGTSMNISDAHTSQNHRNYLKKWIRSAADLVN